MRIDKFLKNSRLIKRRTVAKEACDADHVSVNGKPAKPGTNVEPGDVIEIRFGSGAIRVRVLATPEHAPKDVAATMYELI